MNGLIIAAVISFIGISVLLFFVLQTLSQRWQEKSEQVKQQWAHDFTNMFLFWSPTKLYWLHVVGCFLGPLFCYLITDSVFLALVILPACVYCPKIWISFAQRRRFIIFDEQLPDALMQIAGALRSGSSLINAMAMIHENSRGPVSQEFGLLVREYRVGNTLEQALQNLETRMKSENLSLAVTTARIAQDTGGNLAESFERLAESLRQKIMIEKKIKSLTSQGKLQGIVVGLLPLGIAVVLSKIEPEAMSFLLHSLFGYITLFIVIVLELMGLAMIRKIVTIDV